MSSLNLLTPPTTPDDECPAPQFPCNLELIIFVTDDRYKDIEFRGKKTKDGIRIKVKDIISYFKLTFADIKTVTQHLVAYEGLDILVHNVPKLALFRDWLESVMDVDLHCYEEIDYDGLGW